MATKRSRKSAEPASDVSRRQFLHSVIVASAATGAVATLPGAAAAAIPKGAAAAAAAVVGGDLAAAAAAAGAFLIFTDDEAALFSRVANRLIPAQGVMPGGGDIGLATFVDGVLADASHLRQPILDVLHLVRSADEAEHATDEGLDAVLSRIERAHPEAFTRMIEAVYTGYYSHQDVLLALGWEHPGDVADTSESLDARLLDDVVSRGPIYRHV
jgi:hypothetical protein